MGRLCERPGCSEPASVAYGMRAEDLVFWLDTLRPDSYQSSGVLCQRHAESMVVPRHWTLDDLREPVPRLFQPPTTPSTAAAPPPSRRRRTAGTTTVEQLLLTSEAPSPGAERTLSDESDDVAEVIVETAVETAPVPDDPLDVRTAVGDGGAAPWTPTFDESDDLDGLLSARSPLLARAFRGDDRPKPS